MMIKKQTAELTKNSVVSVVDDDESMRRMLSRGIQAAGFDVAVFNSARKSFSIQEALLTRIAWYSTLTCPA
jgi:FixJ family two-component response regulator